MTVSYNSGRYLTDFLASTAAPRTDDAVVVADNGSDDLDAVRGATEHAGARS